MQKPIGCIGSAWWPGGRTAQNAVCASRETLLGAGRADRVGIEGGVAGFRHGLDHRFDEGGRVRARDLLDGGFGRVPALQGRELVPIERLQHRFEPRRPLRVVSAGVVREEGGMGDKQGRHGRQTLVLRFSEFGRRPAPL
jgi:hypothetical protein